MGTELRGRGRSNGMRLEHENGGETTCREILSTNVLNIKFKLITIVRHTRLAVLRVKNDLFKRWRASVNPR